jgi:hypothetical protein
VLRALSNSRGDLVSKPIRRCASLESAGQFPSRGSSLPKLYKSTRCLLSDRFSQIKSNGYE